MELYRDEVAGILIDPVYGKDILDKSLAVGWMLSMEKTGYRGDKLGSHGNITKLERETSKRDGGEWGQVAFVL